MRKCIGCGTPIPESEKFCSMCGAPAQIIISEKNTSQQKTIPPPSYSKGPDIISQTASLIKMGGKIFFGVVILSAVTMCVWKKTFQQPSQIEDTGRNQQNAEPATTDSLRAEIREQCKNWYHFRGKIMYLHDRGDEEGAARARADFATVNKILETYPKDIVDEEMSKLEAEGYKPRF